MNTEEILLRLRARDKTTLLHQHLTEENKIKYGRNKMKKEVHK